jgi:hypothetical protein
MLTESLTNRLILELRRYWASHPRYKKIVPNIQGKYSFKERPSYGIIVKPSSGNRVDLSPDNYLGVIESYVYLNKVKNYPGQAIEWVREDSVAIQNNGGRFPSPAGVYFIEITTDPNKNDPEGPAEYFYVDPLLDAFQEIVQLTSNSTGQLVHQPHTGSLRVYEMPACYMLFEGTNYTLTVDPQGVPTGEVVLTQPLTGGRYIVADYRYAGTSTGPFKFTPGRADNTAIPGTVLAFGRRNEANDRMAVVVQGIRQPSALEYGGRWEIGFDLDIIARDIHAEREITDFTVTYLWGILRSYLSTEGIEMTELSMGGESEETYDENGDDYFYNSTLSLTLSTEWHIDVPLPIFLRHAIPLTVEQAEALASMTDEEVAEQTNDVKMLESLNLETVVDPFFSGRISTYELIN